MSLVRKADFYYGSLLSWLINNGHAPAIIEPGESRRIYSMSTNQGDYQIYAKYVSAPSRRQRTEVQLWQFTFSPDEINFIRSFNENGKKLYFALICGDENLQDSEIALISLDEGVDCLDIGYSRTSHRISIKSERGIHGLKAWGTGRADIINGRDNTIRIPRDRISAL